MCFSLYHCSEGGKLQTAKDLMSEGLVFPPAIIFLSCYCLLSMKSLELILLLHIEVQVGVLTLLYEILFTSFYPSDFTGIIAKWSRSSCKKVVVKFKAGNKRIY